MLWEEKIMELEKHDPWGRKKQEMMSGQFELGVRPKAWLVTTIGHYAQTPWINLVLNIFN